MERERQPIPDTPLSSLPTTAPASAGAWFFPQPSRRGHVTPGKSDVAGIDHSPPPFFKRGPAPLALLSLYLGLSISLMVLDHKFHYLEWVRQGVAVFTTPCRCWPMRPPRASPRWTSTSPA